MTIYEIVQKYHNMTLELAALTAEAEAIDTPDNSDDETYNRAIEHVAEAIRALKK